MPVSTFGFGTNERKREKRSSAEDEFCSLSVSDKFVGARYVAAKFDEVTSRPRLYLIAPIK